MSDYRNIDSVIIDTKNKVITIGPFGPKDNDSGIPAISDIVSLITNRGYPMTVAITNMLDNNSSYRGKVIFGYSPVGRPDDWIYIGDTVEFSREKIVRIYKDEQQYFEYRNS